MGKRIISRARGKGGPRYRAPSHRYAGAITYNFDSGKIIDIVHDPGKDAPLAKVKTERGEKFIVAAEGWKVGDMIDIRKNKIQSLSSIPKGSFIFAIENYPGSGPKICCAAGSHAIVISQELDKTIVQMPSRISKTFNPKCLASVGIAAGGGRGDKPYIKAGQVFFAMQARNKLWPRSSGCKMNPVDHPFGGHTKPGTPKSISKNAPPGAKVGSLASRRTGRRKK